jgi:hypothetical protein
VIRDSLVEVGMPASVGHVAGERGTWVSTLPHHKPAATATTMRARLAIPWARFIGSCLPLTATVGVHPLHCL